MHLPGFDYGLGNVSMFIFPLSLRNSVCLSQNVSNKAKKGLKYIFKKILPVPLTLEHTKDYIILCEHCQHSCYCL